MNKNPIIFFVGACAILWCFGLVLFVGGGNDLMGMFWQKTVIKNVLTADVLSGAFSTASTTVQSVTIVTPIQKNNPLTVLVFGDMMLDRNVRAQIIKNGPEYPFALIKDFLKGGVGGDGDGYANDIVVANAEGPFTYNKSLTLGVKNGPLAFTFDPAILPTLKNLGFTLFCQANNHTLNFGTAGFKQSAALIKTAGLNWFGDPSNTNVQPYLTEIRGEKMAFIGYNQFTSNGPKNILPAIKNAKNNGAFVVVYAHWGDEYNLSDTVAQQKLAHEFVDAGADVVIGAHPHVIEPIEMYDDKPIFYSLGNFIFDQASTGPTSQGLAVKISLTPDFATYDLFPISIIKTQASLATPENRQKILDHLNVPAGTIIVPRGQIVK